MSDEFEFETLLKKACLEYEMRMMEADLKFAADAEDRSFSAGYVACKKYMIKNFEKLKKSGMSLQQIKKKNRPAAKTVKIILAAAIIIAAAAVSAVAYEPVKSFIINPSSLNMTDVLFQKGSGDDYLFSKYEYIPEGYELVEETRSTDSQCFQYLGENGNEIFIFDNTGNATYSLNTEKVDYTEVGIGENVGIYVDDSGVSSLLWSTSKYSHQIVIYNNDNNPVSVEEMVKIAESREKISFFELF